MKYSRRLFVGDSLKVAATAAFAPGLCPLFSAETSARKKKAAWQIGCYTRPWDRFEYRVALDAIKEAGFKHAGLMTTKSRTRLVISAATTPEEAGRVGDEVKKRGLKVVSVYGGGIPVQKSLAAGIEGMKKLIDNCALVKARSLLMGGIGDKALYEPYYRAIKECCDYAASKKLEIVLKPHGGLNATGPQCRKAVEWVNHKNFRLWYDAGNIYYYSSGELDPVEDVRTVNGLVTGMCIKDYKHPKNVLVTPGEGRVDFPAVLSQLKKGGFKSGPLVIETLGPGDKDTLMKNARQAFKFVKGLAAAL